MRRRWFLQSGAGMFLATVTHSCAHPWQGQSPTDGGDNSLASIQKWGYMTVATEDDYPPFEFVENGQAMGYDHALLKLLRQSTPFEIRQQIMPWQGILPGVATGKYDAAVTAVGVTDERSQSLDFTMPIAESTIAYVKRQDDASIQNVKSLSGKTLGVQEGGVSLASVPDLELTLKQSGGRLGEVKQYRGFAEAYQDLLNGQIDAVLHNIVSLSVLANEKPDLFALGERTSRKSYAAWAVKKGNRELLDLLNKFLGQVRETGEMRRLQQQWLKVTFDDLPMQPLLPGDRPILSTSTGAIAQ